MFIFTLTYHDTELYVRTADIKAESEMEAHKKLKDIVKGAQYIKTENVMEV